MLLNIEEIETTEPIFIIKVSSFEKLTDRQILIELMKELTLEELSRIKTILTDYLEN